MSNNDYKVIFDYIEQIKDTEQYKVIRKTMKAAEDTKDPIEALKQMVLDSDECKYRIVTTS